MKFFSTNHLIPTLLLVAMLAVTAYLTGTQVNLAAGDGFAAYDCTVSTSTAMVVGPTSSTLLAEHSRRAWAVIQQPRNATNTVALSFDAGSAAVIGKGYQLFDMATSTGEASKMTFGLNTEMPYTGTVTGIASAGTSSVLVTECRYNR